MTEEEWRQCEDPSKMLKHLSARISERKLRLFSFACCRRVWTFVRDPRLETSLDTLERYADKRTSDKKRLEARREIEAFREEFYDEHREEEICIGTELWNSSTKTRRRVVGTCGEGAAAAFAWADVSDYNNRLVAERAAQTWLIRDIFGNPFRPVDFSPEWRTGTAVTLASQMYESRDFGAMPILADALQDAGCDTADILAHCRDANATHVRGCWVVDLVLGQS